MQVRNFLLALFVSRETFYFCFNLFSLSGVILNHAAYIVGKMSKVKIVATTKPQEIAIAIEPQSVLGTSGIIPSIAAAAVSIIGRKRNTAESIIAFHGFHHQAYVSLSGQSR